MSYYDKIKKELEEESQAKAEFDALEVPAFDEFWDKNQHTLKQSEQKQNKNKHIKLRRKIIYAAASVFLIVGLSISLGLYFGFKDGKDPAIEYRYEDNFISAKDDKNDLLHNSNLYLPDLSILSQETLTIAIGEHIESKETVFFFINGIYDDGEQYREVRLKIILQTKYVASGEDTYNAKTKEKINGYNVSIFDNGYEDPFYSYKLGFKVGEVRYYIDYFTIEENDYADFLIEFLK